MSTLIHILRGILDFIFPPSLSYHIVRETPLAAWATYHDPHLVNGTICLAHYQERSVKAAVTAGKFEHYLPALRHLGQILKTHLSTQANNLPPDTTIFVPIPLHGSRELERGYNQVTEILKAGQRGTPYRTVSLLRRTKATSPQSHLSRAERLGHLSGVFAAKAVSIDWQSVTHVVLFDDVLTTGSTLAAAKTALKPHLPAHVTLITMALTH